MVKKSNFVPCACCVKKVRQLERRIKTLERISSTDALTGLKNRGAFNDDLKRAVARNMRNKTPFTLALLDVDHFKKINDTYGHPFGDCMLKKLAKILMNECRIDDFIARTGGEEFGIILHGTSLLGAKVSIERMLITIQDKLVYNNVRATVSIGIGEYTEAGAIYHRVDKALYVSKQNGRNRVTAV